MNLIFVIDGVTNPLTTEPTRSFQVFMFSKQHKLVHQVTGGLNIAMQVGRIVQPYRL